MKQRSLVRDRVPKQPLQACVRSKYLKQSKKPNPPSYGRRDALRRTFMKFYKKQCAKDAEFGRQINALWREFYDEKRYIQNSGKPPDEETVKYIGNLAKQIKEMMETQRFSKEFPSFSSFYRFVRRKGVTLDDIKEN